ncbi:MAG: acetoacetate--CoA ligase [Acidimicrobiales bacterium]
MTGEVLWRPAAEEVSGAAMTRFLSANGFESYDEAWRWSVTDLDGFWAAVWAFFGIRGSRGSGAVLADADRPMPGARWFPDTRLNYVNQVFRWPAGGVAVVCASEDGVGETLTYGELWQRTAEAAAGLRERGVVCGDRVVAYGPNTVDMLVAFLATASLGAVWSSCSPDFGATAVLDRFRQIEPKVLIAADGYRYKGRFYDRREVVAELSRSIPSLTATALFDDLARPEAGDPFAAEPVPFDHPLWVLYSSGTTGLPKAIVHGHGGIVLEHVKFLSLHAGLRPTDRFFWFTSTGWMMWNLLVGGLLVGSTAVLYNGSPGWPDLGALWRMADDTGVTHFGASAPYLQACAKAGVVPSKEADLSAIRGVGSTGAPLPADGFRWVYENVGRDLLLGSVSGGTDVCTAFVGSNPVLPVRAGEIQCRCLGAKVEAFDEAANAVTGQVGELVLTEPMPSMPLYLWGDGDGSRYRSSYFEPWPGVWRHGDWVTVTAMGGVVISGRSDATLNRGGVRIGTAELYRVVEAVDGVADSLVVDTGGGVRPPQAGRLLLFVVLAEGATLDAGLIRDRIRTELSPRHVPDEIMVIAEVPRTLNGKKLEVPVKRILLGEPPDKVVSPDALANPDALTPFLDIAQVPL